MIGNLLPSAISDLSVEKERARKDWLSQKVFFVLLPIGI